MEPLLEEIKPETAARLAELARANGKSIDEYVNSLLPHSNGQVTEGASGNERPLSGLLSGLVGVIDSREPFSGPRRARDAFGKGVIAKLEKQGLKLP